MPEQEPTAEAERDQELGRLLRLWRAPAASDALDERVLASFRRATAKPAGWRRWFTVSIPVPLPVAVAALLLLLASAAFVLRRPTPHAPSESQMADVTRTADRRDPSVVTQTSLAGFQPVEDMNVTVIAAGSRP
jgi:hypothetical protein